MDPTPSARARVNSRLLIVFVALVLLLGTTFGVFINTVVFLQDETTTDQSADEALTIDGLQLSVNDPDDPVVAVSDRIDDEGDPVAYELRLELRGHADTADIDLTDLRIDIEGSGVGIMRHVSQNVADGELEPDGEVDGTAVARDVYFLQPVAVDELDGTLAPGDRYEVVVPLGLYLRTDGALVRSVTDDSRVAAPANDYEDADVLVTVPGVLGPSEGLDNSAVGPLEAGDEISVTITTEGAVEETIEVRVPGDLSADAGGSVAL